MSRYNAAVRTGVRSPVTSITPAYTALGGEGVARDARSELFLLAASNMSDPKGAFHESGQARDERYTALLHNPEVYADATWARGFISWLRDEANLRSASLVAAAEIVHARLHADPVLTGNRDIVSAALQRADEPGEFLAYWVSQHGRKLPMPVKRGVADAAQRLYRERSYLKWDSEAKNFRFADVLQLTHPAPSVLFKHILDQRYRSQEQVYIPETLSTLRAHKALMDLPVAERQAVTAGQLAEAGMTWESLAGWQQAPMDAASWEKIIPSMGVMALLRNLRNFDQAGISRTAHRMVEDKLTDPEEIRRSRQLPMRFLNAYRATRDSGTVTAWGPTIEEALNLSLQNVPVLDGHTLILVDLSGSMYERTLSERSDLRWADAAAVFGAALAKRSARADLYGFGWIPRQFHFSKSSSVLPLATSISETTVNGRDFGWYEQEIKGLGGTETPKAIQETFVEDKHTRVVIITDEQYGGWEGTVQSLLEATRVPCYTWNLAGYRAGQARSGSRKLHTFGGLSDTSFKAIPAIEAGQHQAWPWESR
jgi:hypothetical protein